MTAARAQTTVDYTIGIGIFLVAVTFTFAFVPTIFTPFVGTGNEYPQTANRIADRLADDALAGSTTRPSVLNETCTAGFFDADGSAPAGCAFEQDASDLNAAVGVAGVRSVNVTITTDGDLTTVDGTLLAAGPDVPPKANAVAASRIVLIDGDDHLLKVRVW
ncbi:MAG: hypothetical protein ABEJ08_03970 [Halobacteriaceae archaeon]